MRGVRPGTERDRTAEALASPAREQEREEVRRRRRERCLEIRGGIQPDGSHLLDDHCLTEWSSNEEWAVEGAEYVMPPNDNPPVDRTPEEQRILDLVAADRGREYAERWAERILEQARAIGDL